MIFAARLSKAFIAPDEVVELERWSSRGILDALIEINLPANVGCSYSSSISLTRSLIRESNTLQRCHEEAGSVWEFK
jgi:hypothetical protein